MKKKKIIEKTCGNCMKWKPAKEFSNDKNGESVMKMIVFMSWYVFITCLLDFGLIVGKWGQSKGVYGVADLFVKTLMIILFGLALYFYY
jgi:hypothetical protein